MLRALLFDPWTFFRRRSGDMNVGRGAALGAGLSVVLVAGLAAVLWSLSRQITGTVTVDNPARPQDTFCDGSVPMEITPSGCDEPAEITRQFGALFWEQAQRTLPGTFVGVVVVLAVVAFVLYVGARIAQGTGAFGPTLEVTAWGFVPSLLTAAVGGVLLVAFASQADLTVDDPQGLLTQFRSLTRGLSGLALTALGLVGTVWQAYVWAGGLAVVHDLDRAPAGAIAGLVALVLVLLSL